MSALLLLLTTVSSAYATSCGFSRFTDTDKNQILKVHNDLRSSIAKGTFVAGSDAKPAGADIQTMTWDCSLEQGAQRWAETCPVFGPSGHSGAPGVGENMYWSWSTAPLQIAGKGAEASRSWANEFQEYGWWGNTFTDDLFYTVGHATQMAWASTNKVGCGVKLCPGSDPFYPYEVVVACQYSPPGNYFDENIYTEGDTCSLCNSCDSNTGLCTA